MPRICTQCCSTISLPVGSQCVILKSVLYIRKIMKWQTLTTAPMSTADHFSPSFDLRLPNNIQICVPNALWCLFDPGKSLIGNSLRPPKIFTKTKAAIPVPAFIFYRIDSYCGRHVVYMLSADVRIHPSPSRYEIGQWRMNRGGARNANWVGQIL